MSRGTWDSRERPGPWSNWHGIRGSHAGAQPQRSDVELVQVLVGRSDVELVQVLVDVGGEPADQAGEVALVLG